MKKFLVVLTAIGLLSFGGLQTADAVSFVDFDGSPNAVPFGSGVKVATFGVKQILFGVNGNQGKVQNSLGGMPVADAVGGDLFWAGNADVGSFFDTLEVDVSQLAPSTVKFHFYGNAAGASAAGIHSFDFYTHGGVLLTSFDPFGSFTPGTWNHFSFGGFGSPITSVIYTTTAGTGAHFGIDGFTAIPEPATMMLMGSGLFGLAGIRKRKLKAAVQNS